MRPSLLFATAALLLFSLPVASADTRCDAIGPQVSVCDASSGACEYTFVVLHGTGTVFIAQRCETPAESGECILAVAAAWCHGEYTEQDAEVNYLFVAGLGYHTVYTEDQVYECTLWLPGGPQPCPAGTERLLPGPNDLGQSETWGHVLP